MKQRLPGVCGYNPPIWDRVVVTSRFVAAAVFTASGQQKLFQMGWDDAVDGKHPRGVHNVYYMQGYHAGLDDLAGNEQWRIRLRATGEVLAEGFNSLAAANAWHDTWLDRQPNVTDFNYPAVDFEKY